MGQWQEGQLQCYRTAPSAAGLTWEGPAHEGLHQSRLAPAGPPPGTAPQNSARTSGPPVGNGRKKQCDGHMGKQATVRHAVFEALLLLKEALSL